MISSQVRSKLIEIVGSANYDDSNAGRLVYSYDATPQFQSMPDAVIAPRKEGRSIANRENLQHAPHSDCAERFRYKPMCRHMPD